MVGTVVGARLQTWVPSGMTSDSRVLAAAANNVGLQRRGIPTSPGPRGQYPGQRPPKAEGHAGGGASICSEEGSLPLGKREIQGRESEIPKYAHTIGF